MAHEEIFVSKAKKEPNNQKFFCTNTSNLNDD